MARARRKSKLRNFIEIFMIICLVIGSVAGMYLNDGYDASEEAARMVDDTQTLMEDNLNLTLADHYFACAPDQPRAGIVFYPGALVDYKAYAPLMKALADQGILAVDLNMPLDLAILKKGAAKEVLEYYEVFYPDLDWYVAGHSMGGFVGAGYGADHAEDFAGVILMGSYSVDDLKGTSLKVLSILGSEDEVLSKDSYEENKKNLPEDYTEYVIQGGCHAGFGDYGAQKKDGSPSISSAEQIEITAQVIGQWIQ